jgi:hypothetical protein
MSTKSHFVVKIWYRNLHRGFNRFEAHLLGLKIGYQISLAVKIVVRNPHLPIKDSDPLKNGDFIWGVRWSVWVWPGQKNNALE